MSAKTIIIGMLVVLVVIFILQNIASVTVTFLMFDLSMPRSLLLALTFFFGIVVGALLPFGIKREKGK